MNGKRLACAVVPDFLLHVAASAGLHIWERPHAIAEKEGAAALLAAVNSLGMQDGVTVGMTVAQARARCPELEVTVRNQDHEDEQSGRILKLLQSIGPFVEEEAPGVYYLQAAGLTRLYHDETGLARRILSDLHPANYPVQVGIAANKLV
ncbi:MAG TPA: hypothetical protein VN285_06065, partial [Candidatus Deferrimicrobium sp.]|nr:hypothetical protein [Candidatus Deferrimicrobium sp.]